jgi:hypothetical protein
MIGTTLQFTQAKARLSDVYDEVEQRLGVRVIARQKSHPVAIVRRDELARLLEERFPFSTRMSRASDGTVSVWLNEFDIFGRGKEIADAVDDLLDEVEQYVDEWEETLHHAPNHARRAWWVRRVQLAEDRDDLRNIIFPIPEVGRASPATS